MENYDGHAAKRQRTDGESGQRVSNDDSGQAAYYNYPSGQRQSSRGSNEDEKPNHVLLMTIINPAYPITVEVINTICIPSGPVLRIVIFKKNGVQAMVEFDSVESAQRAKQSLNGADIYSGCCTLKIEYAKPTRLNVYKNDNDSWDYTNPNLGKNSERPGPLLQEPRFGSGPTPYTETGGRSAPGGYGVAEHGEAYESFASPRSGGGGGGNYPPYGAGQQEHYGGHQERHDSNRADGFDGREGPPGTGPRGGYPQGAGGGGGSVPQQGAVMMVYGLNHEKINADKLFNLFCLYGNVVRIKFLKSKEGCAMVQLGDSASVDRAIRHLNNATFFGTKMQLWYSKQAFLNDVQQPFELPDGTPSFKDFMGNRNNRFTNPEASRKNRIQPPCKVLHFFNTPYGITEDDIKKVFEENELKPPKSVKMFTSKSKFSERSSSGLLEWDNTAEALESLVICNHTPIPNPNGKFPYILKLCFSLSNPRAM